LREFFPIFCNLTKLNKSMGIVLITLRKICFVVKDKREKLNRLLFSK